MVKEFVKGKKYDTLDGVGIFVEYDSAFGNPMFEMIGEHKWSLNSKGVAVFEKDAAMEYFKELPDEAV